MQHHQRIVSGMRPTGSLHLGHYHGCLKQWSILQHEYDCFFSVADLHALTTHYEQEDTAQLSQHKWEMIVDWLACGLDPNACHIFMQSSVPEHAELHLLLSMITPLSWLERVPTFKEQQDKLKEHDLSTYGFLGYPLLQAADILAYKAGYVPVGEDQVPHVELARELARRFNHKYGREMDFATKVNAAIAKMSNKQGKLYQSLSRAYQERGDHDALKTGQALINSQANLSVSDKERLLGYLEGSGKIILPEPEVLLSTSPKLPGVDGQKMSKSYKNSIYLRDDANTVTDKVRTMITDPARVRRSDPGEPEKCPVWNWHQVYSDGTTQDWVQQGCRSAAIGCLDCKNALLDKLLPEQQAIRQRALEYRKDQAGLRQIVAEGTEAARDITRESLQEVHQAMGLEESI